MSNKPPATGFVKSAMRNMVRKGKQSLVHFGLTAFGFVVFILCVAWLGRPNFPS
ncbi:MAG: DUF3285 domain-containing protein [Prochlorococcaceae cyanobacterium ETNP1_MAG_9]|nr:DUF3285 domain-containing protein [Prochlorococcaceae cyanobacterium ETNP1_MAG_9]